MLEIKEIHDQKIWDNFVLAYAEKTFLHAWQWGEFNCATGDPPSLRTRRGASEGQGKIWRFGIYEDEKLFGVALIIKIVAKRGTFFFCPHGPLIDWNHETHFSLLLEYIKKLAQQENVHFIRISPLLKQNPSFLQKTDYTKSSPRHQFGIMGFRSAPIHMHAETTWTLDLTPTEEQLLAAMRKTTRNLIHRAEREGVNVEIGESEQLIDIFYHLHSKTVERQHFVPFSKKYIAEEVKAFTPGNIIVAIAKLGAMPTAGAIVPLDNVGGYYHHGASIPSKIPAAYLLQWRIIQALKKRGLRYYNFWGIAPTDNPKHPWHGLSLFKQGFGGYRTDYVHAQDLPLSWHYWINYTIESLRRWKRGF